MHYVQPDVGHYGVFNGSRFRKEIAPRILSFYPENIRRPCAECAARVIKGGKKRLIALIFSNCNRRFAECGSPVLEGPHSAYHIES